MLVLMQSGATESEIAQVEERICELGFTPHTMPGKTATAIGITGNSGPLEPAMFAGLAGIARVIAVTQPFKLVSREVKQDDTVIDFGDASIGGAELALMAGPCSVESRDQIMQAAIAAKAAGAKFLRGGAFKPRTSPYAFQGLKEEGLKLLAEARDATGLRVVTEVKDTETLEMVADYADVLQVGARNMQNYSLLEALGNIRQPVLLKRGMSATIKEWLMCAEYVVARGNRQVILCERGLRTFETMTRNTMDVGAIPLVKHLSHLPVVADPSHGIGIAQHVTPLALGCVAAGADGLIIEMHPDPSRALSDGDQSLTPEGFSDLVQKVERVAAAVGRRVVKADDEWKGAS